MNPFFRWWLLVVPVAVGLGFAQHRFDLLARVQSADNAQYIEAMLLLGVVVILMFGRAAWVMQRGAQPNLAIPATIGEEAPMLGLAGTVFGIIDLLTHLAGSSSAGHDGLVAALPAIGACMISTAVGVLISVFSRWLSVFITGRSDV